MQFEGKFKVSGTGWLCVYDKLFRRWQPIMELTKPQIEYWKTAISFVKEN
jgi:hypothetical protein